EEPNLEEVAYEISPADAAPTVDAVSEVVQEEEEIPTEPFVTKWRKHIQQKRGNEEVEANAPPKVLRKDYTSNPTSSTHTGKSLASMGLDTESTLSPTVVQSSPTTEAATDIPAGGAAAGADMTIGSPNSGKSISLSLGGSPTGIYQPGWGVTNDCRLDTSKACQEVVDHSVPLGYFVELRHLPNSEFLGQYNMNLARQVVQGSQLRLRFKQEARLLKKATEKIARRNQRIQAREDEINKLNQEVKSLRVAEKEVHGLRNQTQNLETLLEAEVSTLQTQVTGEVRIKAAFEEFKRSEDKKVEQRCAEMDARLDVLSIDFDEELYPHMLTAIAGRRWIIGHGLRLAVLKYAESLELRHAFPNVVSVGIAKGYCDGLKYAMEQGKVELDLESIEAYDPEAKDKFVATMQVLKDL
ncbi:hypothetical protein Tco_1544693, partial [Tanacetum coccineum]